MGIFDIVERLGAIADNPNLGKAAEAIGETAVALPDLLQSIDKSLKLLASGQADRHGVVVSVAERIELLLTTSNATLLDISMGLDAMNDPVKRPPFHAADVEAAMRGEWPPNASIVHDMAANGDPNAAAFIRASRPLQPELPFPVNNSHATYEEE